MPITKSPIRYSIEIIYIAKNYMGINMGINMYRLYMPVHTVRNYSLLHSLNKPWEFLDALRHTQLYLRV